MELLPFEKTWNDAKTFESLSVCWQEQKHRFPD